MDDSFYIPTEDAADDVLIFPIGKFYRGGVERQFTPDDAALMVANFEEKVLGESRLPPVNREHKREDGKIGNITSIWQTDDGVRGKVDGDLDGFDYISPEVRWEWTNPYTGVKHKNVLMGAGATNYPFFLDKMALNSDDAAQLWTGSDWEPFKDTSRDQLKERQQARAKRYGIGVKGGGALSPPKDYPDSAEEYGDPVNFRYPADATRAQAAVSYFNQKKNKSAGGYSDGEWAIVGKRLARLVGRHLKASYKFADGALVRGDEKSSDEADVETLADTQDDRSNEMSENEVLEEVQPETVEEAAEPVEETEDYAEKIKELEARNEKFAAELDAERQKVSEVSEKFAESEKARRLMYFADVVATFAVSAEPEQFAEDLWAIEHADAELAERMIARFRANAEAVDKGELFAQKSQAQAPEAGDPFLARVEQIRGERFSDKPHAEGMAEAYSAASKEHPDMARDYAEKTRGGQ